MTENQNWLFLQRYDRLNVIQRIVFCRQIHFSKTLDKVNHHKRLWMEIEVMH